MISPNVLVNTFCRSFSLAVHNALVTQLLARNSSVALSVAMFETKCLTTFFKTLSLDCSSGSQGMVASVSSVRSGRAGSATSLPVCQCPGIRRKAKKKKKSSFFGTATCADAKAPNVTSTWVASDTHATIPTLFGGPRASAQSCHKNKVVHRLQQAGAVCLARTGQSAVRWQRAATIVACLALSAGGMHLAIYPSRTLLLTPTRQQVEMSLPFRAA